MKSRLFHAIPPSPDEPQDAWSAFLRDAALWALPEDAECLAPNVWVLPDDRRSYLDLAQIGHRHGIETRTLPFVAASEWQPLSRHP